MKVITLKQPWATLVSSGIKKYEFRSWKTNYRGKILIHAGKGVDKNAMNKFKHLKLEFPSSRIVGEVEIIECIELTREENNKIINENDFIYGNAVNRTGYAWKLKNAREIKSEDIINGKLGIWNIKE